MSSTESWRLFFKKPQKKIRLLLLFALAFSSKGFALCVTANKANLREKPSNKAKITWVVYKYMPLLEVDRKGAWYQVKDVDGQLHWVYSRLVSSRTQCLVVKAASAKVRTGPGTNFPLAEYPSANRYFTFEKLDSEEAWFKIRAASGKGPFWIHENLVWRALQVQTIGF